MSYYSTVEFDVTVTDITETEVRALLEQTLTEWAASRIEVTAGSDIVSVVGYFDEIVTQWYGFAEDVPAFHTAVVGAGGAFRDGYVIRYGEADGDEERFIFKGTSLEHQLSENDTW